MKDGWGAWDRPTFGSWVAVPFLIGSDGWAIFVHSPVGEFDLREAAATFTPWTDQSGTPLVVYVIAWNEPADALREYTRLVGPAPLPQPDSAAASASAAAPRTQEMRILPSGIVSP